LAVAQFVELARFGTQHSPEVMRGFTSESGRFRLKSFHKKSSPHARQ
jgi:hypothetical protein